MKSFNVTEIISHKRFPLFKHSWWRVLIMYFRGRKTNPISNFNLTVAVDSHRGLTVDDVFIGQGKTAWVITAKGVYMNLATGPQHRLDIRSYKPVLHCDVVGPAIPIKRQENGGWAI